MLSDSQVFSKTFHMVCSSSRCISIVQDIMRRREELQSKAEIPDSSSDRPIFVWEPVPDMCTPEELQKFLEACRQVDIVSPNDLELGMMFGQSSWSEGSTSGEDIISRILESGVGPQGEGHIVIRAGKDGCYSYSRNMKLWLPAYHQPDASGSSPVVDPTGAGNSFLGAMAQGMVSEGRHSARAIDSVLAESAYWREAVMLSGTHRILVALILATVAAGFVVEQIGVPRQSTSLEGKEHWNGTEFTERVRLYTERLYRTLEESPQRHLRDQSTN